MNHLSMTDLLRLRAMYIVTRVRRLWEPEVVLIEGSYFPRCDLPRLLGNFIRASEQAQRDAKRAHLQAVEAERQRDELHEVLLEFKRSE